MWPVDRPEFDVGDVFDKCTTLIKNRALRDQMTAIKPDVLELSDDYDTCAQAAELHLIAAHQAGIQNVSGQDLKKNYTQRMARKGKPARPVYDALMILPKNNRCPFCDFGQVRTLDHVLPKTPFPGLAVKPENLVGCCERCNRLKWDGVPANAESCFLHPYFDNLGDERWLAAEIIETTPAALSFYVTPADALTQITMERIQYQFDMLQLGQLYSELAADEISDIGDLLQGVFADFGAIAVSDHLRGQARSRRRIKANSWQAVVYDTLASSEWYCDGGFRLS